MKLNKFAYLALASLAFAACDMEDVVPQGGTLLATQVQETNLAAPSRAEATFSGMFTRLGQPSTVLSGRPDDWGFIMMCFSNDLEAADMFVPNSGYNWFSVCGELSPRRRLPGKLLQGLLAAGITYIMSTLFLLFRP